MSETSQFLSTKTLRQDETLPCVAGLLLNSEKINSFSFSFEILNVPVCERDVLLVVKSIMTQSQLSGKSLCYTTSYYFILLFLEHIAECILHTFKVHKELSFVFEIYKNSNAIKNKKNMSCRFIGQYILFN